MRYSLWPVLDSGTAWGRAAGPVRPDAPAQRGGDYQSLVWVLFRINVYLSVQFVSLSQFIEAILASRGMCQVQFDLYRCWGRRLIWFGTTKRFLQYCLTTIVRLLQWFTSVLKDTAAGILRFRDGRGRTFGSPQYLEWRGTSSWPSALMLVSAPGPRGLESLLRAHCSFLAIPALDV